jgi:glycosyltransferase involved in cell wall biosynthesis
MNICVISTSALLTPPTAYGGIEKIAWLTVAGMSLLGHTVHLIAKRGSKTPPNGSLFEIDNDHQVIEICDHLSEKYDTMIFIDESHDKLLSIIRPDYLQISRYQVMSLTGNPRCPVLISKGQRDAKFGGADWPIIYQSIDFDQLPLFPGKREDYLLYLGQKITEKRIDWACEVAAKTKCPLYIHGPGWGQPECHNLIRGYEILYPEYIYNEGEVGGEEKIYKLQHAKALIHLPGALNWCEAGGIAVLEALAVGTPCIVSRNGCLPEYVQNGANGFVVDSIEEAIDAVHYIDNINPIVCAASVEQFNYRSQAKHYEDLCRKAARGERWR